MVHTVAPRGHEPGDVRRYGVVRHPAMALGAHELVPTS